MIWRLRPANFQNCGKDSSESREIQFCVYILQIRVPLRLLVDFSTIPPSPAAQVAGIFLFSMSRNLLRTS